MPDNQKKKNSTIQLGHFEVISDVDATQFEVFLSYTGKQFDHCGIQIRATGGIGKEAIHRVIQISNSSDSDIGRVGDLEWEIFNIPSVTRLQVTLARTAIIIQMSGMESKRCAPIKTPTIVIADNIEAFFQGMVRL